MRVEDFSGLRPAFRLASRLCLERDTSTEGVPMILVLADECPAGKAAFRPPPTLGDAVLAGLAEAFHDLLLADAFPADTGTVARALELTAACAIANDPHPEAAS